MVLKELKHRKNVIFSHININSFRYKYIALQVILYEKYVDILIVGETKLDKSFPDAQFKAKGYTMYRKDRNSNGGGLILFIKNDITSRQRPDLEFKDIESISIEICIGKSKWLLMGAYKPPSLRAETFSSDFQTTMDKIYMCYQNVILMGDLNFDLLDMTKGKPLQDSCDLFDLKNIVKEPTCFMKDKTPSLMDVILTNKTQSFMKTGQCDTGLSDWHNMTFTVLKGNHLPFTNSQFQYRSFQGFESDVFLEDL